MKGYLKNKLGVVSSVELEKNNMIEEFVSKIQDNGGIEKVRVNMITSSCIWLTFCDKIWTNR